MTEDPSESRGEGREKPYDLDERSALFGEAVIDFEDLPGVRLVRLGLSASYSFRSWAFRYSSFFRAWVFRASDFRAHPPL